MDPLEAIIFPQTLPIGVNYLPLVHFFDSLVYCTPVEDEHQGEVDEHHCRFFAPAPLGDDRERFECLIRELEEKKDHYTDQLGHLSLAGFSDPGRIAGESRGAILSDLLKPKAGAETLEQKKELILWQARLVLKLGEMYDRQQASLEEEMQRVLEKEGSLFEELRQEEDHSFSFTRRNGMVGEKNIGLEEHRLKAWTRLFVLGQTSGHQPLVLVTAGRNGLEALSDRCETLHKRRPEELLALQLPPGEGDISELTELTELAASLRIGLAAGMGGEEWSKLAAAWNEQVQKQWSHEECSRLTLFVFGGVSGKALLLQTFGHSDELVAMSGTDDGSELIAGLLEDNSAL